MKSEYIDRDIYLYINIHIAIYKYNIIIYYNYIPNIYF